MSSQMTANPAALADTDLDAVIGGTIFRVNVDRDEAIVVKKPAPQPSPFTPNGTGAETHDPANKNQSTKPLV